MDYNAKLQLTELINRPELNNKLCADCGSLNPQWCSLTHAIFLCLSCAGVHRGFGVHISFVRSISMDAFSEEQLRRMKLGGNAPFLEFLQSYSPADASGYSPSLSIYDKYHCWAAAQHREQLTATLEGRPWSPSLPPPQAQNEPDSSQNLRKSRTTGRNLPQSLGRSSSPYTDEPYDQKAANEAYFNSLGTANAARPADLPPSQGGRYAGFGNTPTPPPSTSTHPSFGLSSAAAPTLADIQADPVGALGKGWSLFSSAVIGATKAVNENVIQPSVEKVSDPNFRNGVVQTMSNTAKSANYWSKTQLGVDVGGLLGNATPSSNHGTYTALDAHDADQYGVDHEPTLYADAGNDDFFSTNLNEPPARGTRLSSTVTHSSKSVPAVPAKKDTWKDDEWKDF